MSKRNEFRWILTAAVCAALSFAACGGGSSQRQAAGAPAGAAGGQPTPDQAEEPRCSMSCSPDKPRTVVAEISWPLPQRAASRQALTENLSKQSLEVTTFKDGFNTGAFAQLGSVQENQRFASRAAAQDVTTAASLQSLAVTRVATLEDRVASGASRSAPELMPQTAGNDAGRVVVVEIEGLEPGLNYYWRRSPGGRVVRCQAPVCPFDAGRGARR